MDKGRTPCFVSRGRACCNSTFQLTSKVIWFLKHNPRAKLKEIAKYFSVCMNQKISPQQMSDYLRKMGWSLKVPTKFQINKYTLTNMEYYLLYLENIVKIPKEKLKFSGNFKNLLCLASFFFLT